MEESDSKINIIDTQCDHSYAVDKKENTVSFICIHCGKRRGPLLIQNQTIN